MEEINLQYTHIYILWFNSRALFSGLATEKHKHQVLSFIFFPQIWKMISPHYDDDNLNSKFRTFNDEINHKKPILDF